MRTLKTIVLAALTAAVVASPAWAAPVNLSDATRKARGDYGQRATVAQSYRVERAAPTVDRTFSYEPTQATQPCQAPAVQNAAPDNAAMAAPAPNRAFSYEPAQRNVRTYRAAPRRDMPTYMLPKGDPHRYDPVIR